MAATPNVLREGPPQQNCCCCAIGPAPGHLPWTSSPADHGGYGLALRDREPHRCYLTERREPRLDHLSTRALSTYTVYMLGWPWCMRSATAPGKDRRHTPSE